jgi:Tfp pilus assembly protein PilN
VRRVNLIPTEERATVAEARHGSSYVVIGVLGALVVAALIYVVTLNQITDREDGIARTNAKIAEEESKGAELSPYERFAAIKENRLQSVRQLAGSRFDFERLMRELALVLPPQTWITNLEADTSGNIDENSETVEASATPSPTLKVDGCTTSQKRVAVVLVRLRRLYRASGSELLDSTEQGQDAASGNSSAPSDSAGASSDCGDKRFKFSATVSFSPTPAGGDTPARVPASLGGGA